MSKRCLRSSANGEFELRHWRSTKRRPSAIRIPNGDRTSSEFSEINPVLNGDIEDDEGYISLRDILSLPEYADASSPVTGGSWPEINIRNPLVKHAAYAYLQPNSSARGVAMQRRVDVKRIFLEIFSPCLEFLGVIFNFRRS